MRLLKLSTARAVDVVVVLSSDHIAGATGKTLTIYATKNGGAAAAITPTVSETDSTNMPGVYSLALTTTHTNTLGDLTLHVTAASCDPTDITFQVVTDLPGDTIATVNGFAANSITAAAIADNAIDNATFAADTGRKSVRSNTAQAGASGTITLDASASSTNDFYVGAWVNLTGGTGSGQSRLITAYNGTSKVATIARNWATNPDNTSTFAILPAAAIIQTESVTGAVGSVTGAVGSVTGAVGSVTGAVGSVTGNVGGNVTGSVGSVASGGITSSSFAASAINAAAIAADAITDAKVAADVTIASVTGSVGSVTGAVGSVTGNVGGNVTGSVGSVTGNVGGNVTGSVGSIASGGITAASFATDAIDANALKADAVTEIQSGLPTAAGIADAVWDEAQSGHTSAGTFGKYLDTEVSGVSGGSVPTAAEVADAVWDEARSDHTTSGTFGQGVASVQGNVTGSAGSVTGAVGSVAAGGITSSSFAADAITAAKVAADVTTELQAGLATASALSTLEGKVDTIDSNVDAILVDTAEIGAAGAGLSAIPWNAAWDAEVQSEAADALNAYDPPTKAELDAAVSPLATTAGLTPISDVTTRLDSMIEEGDSAGYQRYKANALEEAPAFGGSGDIAAIMAVTEKLDTMIVTDSTGSRYTEDALALLFTHLIENGFTFEECARLWNTQVAVASGMGTPTNTFRNLANTKDRVVGENVDANGNRVGPITYDVTP